MGKLDQEIRENALVITTALVAQVEELPDGVYSVKVFPPPPGVEHRDPTLRNLYLDSAGLWLSEVICYSDPKGKRVIIIHRGNLPDHFSIEDGRIVG